MTLTANGGTLSGTGESRMWHVAQTDSPTEDTSPPSCEQLQAQRDEAPEMNKGVLSNLGFDGHVLWGTTSTTIIGNQSIDELVAGYKCDDYATEAAKGGQLAEVAEASFRTCKQAQKAVEEMRNGRPFTVSFDGSKFVVPAQNPGTGPTVFQRVGQAPANVSRP